METDNENLTSLADKELPTACSSPFLDLRCCDNIELMAQYPDNHFDLAIVDPPYGIGVKTNMGRRSGVKNDNPRAKWDSKPPSAEYFIEMMRVSKNQIVWGANHFISLMPMDSSCWIVWDKKFSNEVSFASAELAWTSFDSVCKKFVMSPNQDSRIHPTQKPVKLYEWLLANYAEKGMKILDTHMGSGSIAIACHYAECYLTACELDRDYYRKACKRIERETSQTAFSF